MENNKLARERFTMRHAYGEKMKLRPNEIFFAALGATMGAGADHILSNAQPMKQLIMVGDAFGVIAAAVIVSAGIVGGAYKLGDIIEKKCKPKSDFSHNS